MNKSFTLIEILVVIVVIGVLSAFILVGMSSITNSASIAKGKAFANSMRNSLLMGLVSEWKFEGPTNAESTVTTDDAKDSWGGNNVNFIGGNSVVKNSNCISGKCIYFDGTGDYLSAYDSSGSSLDITDAITISVWVNITSVQNSNYEYIIRKTASDPSQGTLYGLLMGYNDRLVRFFIWTEDIVGCGLGADSLTQLDLNKWYYLSATYDYSSHTGKIYINGILDGTRTSTTGKLRTNNDSFYISQKQDGTLYFNGYIDEVALYNQAMPASSVSEKYYSGLNKLFKNSGIGLEEYSLRISQLKEVLTKY
ncbi:MAG: LamG domain-containing protein [Candidatus Pacebacteria bacterium]|nr:LamG domain-containing protein [Candidatus Paceibacterota bacterium]